MAEYMHTREKDSEGQWNIDNVKYIDGEGNMIHLCNDLESVIPGINFNLICDGNVATVITDQALDAGQQTTLSNTITTYKAQ